MATQRKPVDVSYVDLSTGNKRTIWRRALLRQYLGVSEPTFKRDLSILISECPEFNHFPYGRTFSDFQRHCFDAIRQWRDEGCIEGEIRKKLREEGLPDYDSNKETTETRNWSNQRCGSDHNFASC